MAEWDKFGTILSKKGTIDGEYYKKEESGGQRKFAVILI
jgi:hypothetical protein